MCLDDPGERCHDRGVELAAGARPHPLEREAITLLPPAG